MTISWDDYSSENTPAETIKEYIIRIKKKPWTAETERIIDQVQTTSNFLIDGLDAGRTYEIDVQVAIVNFGKSEWSNMITVEIDTNSNEELSQIDTLKSDFVRYTSVQIIIKSIFNLCPTYLI